MVRRQCRRKRLICSYALPIQCLFLLHGCRNKQPSRALALNEDLPPDLYSQLLSSQHVTVTYDFDELDSECQSAKTLLGTISKMALTAGRVLDNPSALKARERRMGWFKELGTWWSRSLAAPSNLSRPSTYSRSALLTKTQVEAPRTLFPPFRSRQARTSKPRHQVVATTSPRVGLAHLPLPSLRVASADVEHAANPLRRRLPFDADGDSLTRVGVEVRNLEVVARVQQTAQLPERHRGEEVGLPRRSWHPDPPLTSARVDLDRWLVRL